MINLGIRYFNKDNSSGVVLAGDRGAPDPTYSDVIVESDPFIQIGDFPVVFAPRAYYQTAIISDCTLRLTEYFYKKFKNPKDFSVLVFKQLYHELHKKLDDVAKNYSETESKSSLFEFFLSGSDSKGQVFLYCGDIKKQLYMEDIDYTPGYIVSNNGRQEGMVLLTSIIGSKKISKRNASETAIAVLKMLCKIKIDMSGHFELITLEKGKTSHMKKENIVRLLGIIDFRWNAVWAALKTTIKEPKYAEYLLNKFRGIK